MLARVHGDGDVLRRRADHAAIATTMPKENEADITVLVSKTERAQDGETMVALTVRDARKWRISSQANCWFRVSPKASPCKPRDKGEADLRRARSDDTLLQAVPELAQVHTRLQPSSSPHRVTRRCGQTAVTSHRADVQPLFGRSIECSYTHSAMRCKRRALPLGSVGTNLRMCVSSLSGSEILLTEPRP